jgi:hypothetical protein
MIKLKIRNRITHLPELISEDYTRCTAVAAAMAEILQRHLALAALRHIVSLVTTAYSLKDLVHPSH